MKQLVATARNLMRDPSGDPCAELIFLSCERAAVSRGGEIVLDDAVETVRTWVSRKSLLRTIKELQAVAKELKTMEAEE